MPVGLGDGVLYSPNELVVMFARMMVERGSLRMSEEQQRHVFGTSVMRRLSVASNPVTWVYPMKDLGVVHDGDTVHMTLDLGFGEEVTETFRLLGINAPELRGPEPSKALAAKGRLEQLISGASSVVVRTHRTGDFGRWLCTIWADGVNVNQRLLDEGLAIPYKRK